MLEWLKEILGDGYSEDVDKQVSAEIGKRFVSKNDFDTKNTELKGVKAQLDDANSTIQSYKDMDIDGIKQAAADWETKYNDDTQKLKDDLAAANYGFAVKEAVSGLKFSSESAKKTFVADLTEKKLTLQDGKLLGLEDFTKAYQEADPGAFVPEDDDHTPIFSRGTGGSSGQGGGQMSMKDAIAAAMKKQ